MTKNIIREKNNYNKKEERRNKILSRFQYKGSALIFTMFILAGMLIVAMSGSYIILTGIIASGIQSQSTKAYFAAEAGAENILWQFRYGEADYGIANRGTGVPIKTVILDSNLTYSIYHTFNISTLHSYSSVGTYNNIRRSVEVSF